jgi:DNA-binding XRE family transcriptional regulator
MLAMMGKRETPPDELAKLLKAWRAAADIPASRAAQILGIPERTIEGIEQGRGFRYGKLLILALMAFSDRDGHDPPG